MTDESKPQGIPSPLGALFGFGKPPIVKHLDITMHRPRGSGGFLEHMALLALVLVGVASAWAFNAFTPGSLEDWVATAAFTCWNLACVLSIVEHSRRAEVETINGEDQALIKKAIDQFTKV